ncbi:hypothetical protein JST97_09405 [bacterium]|nr:hypothetical protein [bacterium]
MSNAGEVIDLDYDSPLEQVFGFLGSAPSMAFTTFGIWFLFVCPGKNGRPPIWADFPLMPFIAAMTCIWAVGYWLKVNYDVRYQLNPHTQQLEIVRNIFGKVFKTRVCEFSKLYAAGVMSHWWDSKAGRQWLYAVCLVTKSAQMVRVSSFDPIPPLERSKEIASTLGLDHFDCGVQVGTMVATLGPDGKVSIGCAPASPRDPASAGNLDGCFKFFGVFLALMGCAILGGVFYLWVTQT